MYFGKEPAGVCVADLPREVYHTPAREETYVHGLKKNLFCLLNNSIGCAIIYVENKKCGDAQKGRSRE